jgi:hypothetical protein
MSDEAKAALAIAIFKHVPDWVAEIDLMSEAEVAIERLDRAVEYTFTHQTTIATTATVAEMTGKNTTGNMGEKGMLEKEADLIAANLARPEYQPKRGVFLDTEGNTIKPEAEVIAALPIAKSAVIEQSIEDLAKEEFLTDLIHDVPRWVDARDKARVNPDSSVLAAFNKKLNAAAALYAADMEELDAALAMVTKAVNALL